MRRNRALAILVSAYFTLAVVLAVWAGYLNITLPQQEHLMPSMLLFFMSLPSSATTGLVYIIWPDLFDGMAQLGYLALCAAFQASVLFLLLRRRRA